MRIYTLRFWNPVFDRQTNVTVRRGDKWACVRPHDGLSLRKTNTPNVEVARGVVLGVAVIPFSLLPQSWIKQERDVRCRTREALLFSMQAMYPGFNPRENVTAIHFDLQK